MRGYLKETVLKRKGLNEGKREMTSRPQYQYLRNLFTHSTLCHNLYHIQQLNKTTESQKKTFSDISKLIFE